MIMIVNLGYDFFLQYKKWKNQLFIFQEMFIINMILK